MGLIDQAVFSSAIFLIVVGLIFEASGFGIIVVGRLDGVVLIIMGISMFWAGWEMSGARGVSCATAAVLNMFDGHQPYLFGISRLIHWFALRGQQCSWWLKLCAR